MPKALCNTQRMLDRAIAMPRSCRDCGLGPCKHFSPDASAAIRKEYYAALNFESDAPRQAVSDLQAAFGLGAKLRYGDIEPVTLPAVRNEPPPMPEVKPALQPVSISTADVSYDVKPGAETVGGYVRAHIGKRLYDFLHDEGDGLDWLDARNIDALVDVFMDAQREALER